MLPIYGTPLGGKRENIPDFMRNRVVLIPWKRDEDLQAAKLCGRGIVVDNSAFTAWRSGEAITDWPGYYAWVREIYRHPSFMWAAIPDVIDGSEEDNDRLLDEWPSDLRHVGVPVYHMHESLERADRLANTYPLIALGSSGEWSEVGTDGWWDRMSEIMAVICDEQGLPKCKLHGMRMLNPAIFQHLPLASADSTNVAQNAAREAMRHRVSVPTARRIMAEQVEQLQSAERWDAVEKPKQFSPFAC